MEKINDEIIKETPTEEQPDIDDIENELISAIWDTIWYLDET